MIEIVFITMLCTITIIQTLRKWNFFDWYSAKYGHAKWLPDGSCMLCFGFWLSIMISALYMLAKSCHAERIFIPFACAGTINFISTFLNILSDRNTNK
jgi:hypothetical protein